MHRAQLACLVLSTICAVSPAVVAAKPLKLPPPAEGMTRHLPRAFDLAPALHYDGDTDCWAWVIDISASDKPRDERRDGCAVIRRETAAPFNPALRDAWRVV
jgi:hypothetical protein